MDFSDYTFSTTREFDEPHHHQKYTKYVNEYSYSYQYEDEKEHNIDLDIDCEPQTLRECTCTYHCMECI